MFKFSASPVFVSDGCSGYFSAAWKFITGKLPPWEGCCYTHDYRYWSGGVMDPQSKLVLSRRQADDFLFSDIAHHSKFWAWTSWLAVRVGGSQYLPFSWRWRYRESYWSVLKEVVS